MNEQGTSGYPKQRGLYECTVARWSDVRGYDVVGCEIKYFRGPLKASEIIKK